VLSKLIAQDNDSTSDQIWRQIQNLGNNREYLQKLIRPLSLSMCESSD
jgi:hypothetical protein